jgi:hypothetical protein
VLIGGALVSAGSLAVVGGLAVGGPGLVGAGLAATLAGCTAAGIAREAPEGSRGSALEAAVRAAGWTAGVVLVVAGVSTVAGGAVAVVVVLSASTAVALRWGRRQRGRGTARRGSAQVVRLSGGPTPAGPLGDSRMRPVAALSTRALGEEWLRTTAALAGRLSPAARASLVGRREEALDELERRDPDGFARWLVADPASDPADFVREGPAQRGPVADTDAA